MIVFDTNVAAGNATTQYLNFEFDSMVRFGDKFMCAGETGLYLLEGSTRMFPDTDGTYSDITCYFEPVTMDFGISNHKRLRAAYFGYESDGDLTLTISTELHSGLEYTLPATINSQHARKVTVSRALYGRYWTFNISGTGVNFAIDSISVLPIVRGHGIDQN